MARVVRSLVLAAVGTVVLLLTSGELTAKASAQDQPPGEITVVMTELAPFVIDDDGRAEGFYVEIWDEVAERLGLDYDVLWVESFSDVLPAVADGRADVAVVPLAPTAEREVLYDFTSAVVASGPQLAVGEQFDGRPSLLRSMFDARVLRLFLFALGGLLILAHVIWWFERSGDNDDGDFHPSYFRGIWDGLWWSTVTATTVGYGDKAPKSFGGRMIALFAMLSSLVLVAAFVSQVTSIMAEELDGPGIASLDDVDVPIGVVDGTSFAAFLQAEGKPIVGYETQIQMFDAAERGEVDVILTNPFALAAFESRFGFTAASGGVLFSEFETFGLAQGSPWREPINQVLADLHASGEIAEIVKDSQN